MSDRTDASKAARVACAGILVADIFVPPLPTLPQAGALLATDDFLLDTGGCAANTGTVLARLGGSVSVCGVVGDDVFADFIERKLRAEGLDTTAIRRGPGGTSKTVVLTVKGEDRRFIHTFGANTQFTADDLAHPSLAGAGVLYLGGYLILPALDPAATAQALRSFRERGTKVFLDVVVPADGVSRLDAIAPLLPHVDVFKPNNEEAEALTGLAEPRAQAERLMALGCRSVIISQGSKGTLYADSSGVWEAGVYTVDFVDGSGAGDAFAAGYILGLQEGMGVEDRLRFAGATGALACTKLGCTTGITTRRAAEELVASQELEVKRIG
ncbi:MAG: carbohydrate kinase family protein [Chthonomonadales bacterium]|nr:carbohydrate kinase family protein [Chthonomonadales bacterium]